jgi:hypothetical protein
MIKKSSLIHKLLLAVPAALALAGLVAGCGGGSDATVSAHTKASFAKKANVICERGRQEAISSPAAAGPDGVKRGVLPAIQSSLDGVRALDPPAGDEKQVEAVLDSMQKAIDRAMGMNIATTAELEPIFVPSGSLARKYGISSCAYG